MAAVSSLKEALQLQRDIFDRDFSHGPFIGVVQDLAYNKRILFSLKFLEKNIKILDIGCGDGTVTKTVSRARASTMNAIDVSEQAINVAKKFNPGPNITYLATNIEDYNPEERFDGILMFEIIEHLYRPIEVLRKLNSLLNKEGLLLISTPNYKRLTRRIKSALGISHIRRLQGKDGNRIGCDHFQEFDYHQLHFLLNKIGFKIIGYEGIILWTDTVGGKSLKDVLLLQKLNFFLGSLCPAIAGHIYIAARKIS
jgi:SAM-dependent methyltransferase